MRSHHFDPQAWNIRNAAPYPSAPRSRTPPRIGSRRGDTPRRRSVRCQESSWDIVRADLLVRRSNIVPSDLAWYWWKWMCSWLCLWLWLCRVIWSRPWRQWQFVPWRFYYWQKIRFRNWNCRLCVEGEFCAGTNYYQCCRHDSIRRGEMRRFPAPKRRGGRWKCRRGRLLLQWLDRTGG